MNRGDKEALALEQTPAIAAQSIGQAGNAVLATLRSLTTANCESQNARLQVLWEVSAWQSRCKLVTSRQMRNR